MFDLPQKFVRGREIPPQSFNFPIKFLLKGDPHPRKFYIFRTVVFGAKIPETGVKIGP